MARKGGVEGAKRLAILDMLRKNIGAGVLSFRLSSAVIQLSSFADTVGTIGVEYATKGATMISTSKAWRNFIMDNFPEIRKAVGDDIAFREFDNTYLRKFTKTGLKPLQTLDGIMRSTAAAGSMMKVADAKGIEIDLTKPNKELIQEATRMMRQSQGSSFFKDQPLAITAGYGLFDNRSLNKTILTFQSFMLNRWDNIKRQIWREGIADKNYFKAVMSLFWLVFVAAAAEEGMRRGVRKFWNLITGDEKEEQSFIKNSALNMIQNVPLVGQLSSALTYSSNPVPVLNTFDEVLNGMSSVIKGKEISTKIKGGVRFGGALGSLAGIPGSSQLSQIIQKWLTKLGSGESDKKKSGRTKSKSSGKKKSKRKTSMRLNTDRSTINLIKGRLT
jgi:hypothetical protein